MVETKHLRFTAAEAGRRRFRVPEARFFTQTSCGRCGSTRPTVDEDRGVAIVPLDDPPPAAPQAPIWVDSKASWQTIHDALPQHAGPPPS